MTHTFDDTEKLSFTLQASQVTTVAAALQQIPWHVADPILRSLQAQLDALVARRSEPRLPFPEAAE